MSRSELCAVGIMALSLAFVLFCEHRRNRAHAADRAAYAARVLADEADAPVMLVEWHSGGVRR